MTNGTDRSNYLERVRMHEQLASTTDDGQARVMHQAMAAEFRRRAEELGTGALPTSERRPILEMTATIA